MSINTGIFPERNMQVAMLRHYDFSPFFAVHPTLCQLKRPPLSNSLDYFCDLKTNFHDK